MKNDNLKTMKDVVEKYGAKLIPLKTGEVIEVTVLEILKNKIIVDVQGLLPGIIPEKELSPEIGDLKVGDKVLAFVLNIENSEGFCILSLRRADKERVSKILQDKFDTSDVLEVRSMEANKGGLICTFGDYEGFLPLSQLSSSHYPKVRQDHKDEIFSRLKSMVGKNFRVKILTFEPKTNKLIFSEKAAGDQVVEEIKIGDVMEGEITGIVDFGLFINLGEIEGLVHISEVAWEHIDDLKKRFKIGDKVKVKIIAVDNNRVSLSIKKLLPDPWLKQASKYKEGKNVKGIVSRITPFGVYVKVGEIDGLVHISQLGKNVNTPRDVVELGEEKEFEVVSIEPELHKLSLKLIDKKKTKNKSKEKK
jgi:small subunit ribosomal protein S1